MKKIVFLILFSLSFNNYAFAETDYDVYLQAEQAHREGDREKSIELLKKALKANPKYTAAWVLLSGNYILEGRYNEAKEAGLKSVELDPNGVASNFNLAESYRMLSMHKEAKIYYQKFLKQAEKEGAPEEHISLAKQHVSTASQVEKLEKANIPKTKFSNSEDEMIQKIKDKYISMGLSETEANNIANNLKNSLQSASPAIRQQSLKQTLEQLK